MNDRIPLLIISDAPAIPTGMARIARDLANLVDERLSDEIEVAVLGSGALEDSPDGAWPVFKMTYENRAEYETCGGHRDLPRLEEGFFKGRKPIIFPVFDAQRSIWLRQEGAGIETPFGMIGAPIYDALDVYAWGYFPFDSYGVGGLQSKIVRDALERFDRVVVPSNFAKNSLGIILGSTYLTGPDIVDVLPHGYGPIVFYPRDRSEGLMALRLPLDTKRLVGIVATNQIRKDWGLVAETCSLLARADDETRFWWHVDSPDRYWNIPLLLIEFGLGGKVVVTTTATDEALAKAYSACDATLAPGLGEGFGYPILESIACGTPVVHGLYGAGAEIVERGGGRIVAPAATRWDATSFPTIRPVYSAEEWFLAARELVNDRRDPDDVASTVECYRWENLAPHWESWFRAGLEKIRLAESAGCAIAANRRELAPSVSKVTGGTDCGGGG